VRPATDVRGGDAARYCAPAIPVLANLGRW
jgi:hypothetical protein